jgi:chemotaxis signal transduction protein
MTEPQDEGLGHRIERLRAEYWNRLREADDADGQGGVPHVVFDLAGRRFSVDARLSRGVVPSPRVARLPGVPAHILGVAGIRGEVVSVTDPAVFLGAPGERKNAPGYLLILASGQWKAALRVDRVREVAPIREDELLPVDGPWQRVPAGVVVGQKPGGEPPLVVVDGVRYLEASAVIARGARADAAAVRDDVAGSTRQDYSAQRGEGGAAP